MSIEFCDNFSLYGTNTAFMLNGLYAEVDADCALVVDPDGISGGHVFKSNANFAEEGARRVLLSTQATVGLAIRLWMPNLPINDSYSPALTWRNASNNIMVGIGCDTTGRLFISNGRVRGISAPGDNRVKTTTNPVVSANAWWHIEAKMQFSGGSSNTIQYEVRVEGNPVLTGTFTSTNVGPCAQVQIGNDSFSFAPNYWKDFVLWNGSGAANIDFLGSVLVALLAPTADVSLNWTPNPTGTGFSILANIPPDDSKYIDAPNPPPLAYKADMGNLSGDVTSVKAIMTLVRAAKVDGGDGSLQTGIISDPLGTPATVLGVNRPITVAQTYWTDVFEQDPKTGAAWLPSAVNAARLQINRTT